MLIDKFNELSGQAILTYPEELITSEVDFIYDDSGKYFLMDFKECDRFVEITEIFAGLE